MSVRQYGRISFSSNLAGKELTIKFAALSSLHEYFRNERIPLAKEAFWTSIDDFQRATNGLHAAVTEEIFRFPIDPRHRDQIESLGFQLAPIVAAATNDF